MADSPAASDSLAKREPDLSAHDPIVSRSTSAIILISVLLMTGSLVWALYDEAIYQRPWKGVQREFVARYTRYLKGLKANAGKSEQEVKESPEYQGLDEQANAAKEKVKPELDAIDDEIRKIQPQLDAITDPFQNQRGRLMVINYYIETASASSKDKFKKQAERKKQEVVDVEMPAPDGSGTSQVENLDYQHLEARYNTLRDKKAELLGKKAELLKEPGALEKKRNDYLKNQLLVLGPTQIQGLLNAQEKFDYSILGHQVNVPDYNIVDRCEFCHLGTRAPVDIKPENMMPVGAKQPDALARAFVSHPNRELLQLHNPDKFGCAGCHWGNGRATTSEHKAHGNNEHWMWPLFEKANIEAGCQQCHSRDRVTPGAETVNLGRDLFYTRGCVGCHRHEAFDREADALTGTRQMITQLEDQINANDKQGRQDLAAAATASDDDAGKAENQRLLDHEKSLRVASSLLAARRVSG